MAKEDPSTPITLVHNRTPRLPANLEVEGKTMGTSMSYFCQTLDVSKSGLLLSWEKRGKIPFNVNTLVEMTIDPKGVCLERPLRCMGKVVRRESEQQGESKTRLGVHIIQFETEDPQRPAERACQDLLQDQAHNPVQSSIQGSQTWEACLRKIERAIGVRS